HQSEIATVRQSWDLLPTALFGGQPNRSKAELAAITTGAFREFAEALKAPETLEKAIGDCYFKLNPQRNYRQIVQQWTRPLADGKSRGRAERRDELLAELSEAENDYEPRSWSGPVHEIFINVGSQKQGVIEQLEKGSEHLARKFAQQLITFQLQNSESRYAAKSLCSLAQEARRVGNIPLQLEWIEWATRVAPEDAWAHSQAGDVFFSLYRFNEADREYK